MLDIWCNSKQNLLSKLIPISLLSGVESLQIWKFQAPSIKIVFSEMTTSFLTHRSQKSLTWVLCISGHFMQYPTKMFIVNQVPTLEGKTPIIEGRVGFHLPFGGRSLLFWQISYRNIFFLNQPSPTLRGGVPCMIFLYRSEYLMQFLAKTFLGFWHPSPSEQGLEAWVFV